MVKNCFFENRRRDGSRRITAALKQRGEEVGRFRVRRLMREQNLRAIEPKKFVSKTTDSRGTRAAAAPNLLAELSIENCAAAGKVIVRDIPLNANSPCDQKFLPQLNPERELKIRHFIAKTFAIKIAFRSPKAICSGSCRNRKKDKRRFGFTRLFYASHPL